ncbi:MAG: division/cell wall cluster transcriptional repressor MraZ [Sphingobium sp.]
MSDVILYSGNAFSVADGKGRFVLPLDMRKQVKLSSGGDTTLCVSVHGENPCAIGFGESHRQHMFRDAEDQELQARAAGRPFKMDPLNEVQLGAIELVNFDDGGRFALPADFRHEYGIGDAVFFYGVGRYFQMWKPETLLDSKERPELIRNKVRRWLDEREKSGK